MKAELIGYTDKFSVSPEENIQFKISTDLPTYEVTIVRLIHGDENPKGPGFKEEIVSAPVNGKYPGRKQAAHCGSYVLVQDHESLSRLNNLTLQAWICPSIPQKGDLQGLFSKWWATDPVGYGLSLGPDGDLELRIGDQTGHVHSLQTGKALQANQWYFVAATIDVDKGKACLYQHPFSSFSSDPATIAVPGSIPDRVLDSNDAPLLVAAAFAERIGDSRVAGKGLYNGKVDSPRIFSRALEPDEMEQLRRGVSPREVGRNDLVAAWDFSENIATSAIMDKGQHQLQGVAVNMPARAVTGYNWTGDELDCKHAPEQYGAIHFHEEDLDDAGWETDFTLTVSTDLKSGIYAARLRADDGEDYVPFFIRPGKGAAPAPVVLLLPTMTYLAYGNERMQYSPDLASLRATSRRLNQDPLDLYLIEHPEFSSSLYDFHADESGYFYASRLRPLTNLRPKYRKWVEGGPRHLAGDLYLVDWLEQKQFDYEVITDEDLHAEGKELLQSYRVVLTGTHPEYYTAAMRTAMEQYLSQGGRLMYLGGNGFYWVTSVSAEKPHVIEVRRGQSGARAWESAPGECYHSTTGEMGGLWRYRGKAPNKLVGVGCTAVGWGTTSPGYVRSRESFDERVAFIFEGVQDDEIIGNFGLAMGGAAGDELDRLDHRLGTPQHAFLLASSTGHSDHYQKMLEDIQELKSERVYRGSGNPDVRADMVYFETMQDGAVFSVGSISWCGSLSHNHYDNNVSRITENILKKFSR